MYVTNAGKCTVGIVFSPVRFTRKRAGDHSQSYSYHTRSQTPSDGKSTRVVVKVLESLGLVLIGGLADDPPLLQRPRILGTVFQEELTHLIYRV